jgi:hypothetical protein
MVVLRYVVVSSPSGFTIIYLHGQVPALKSTVEINWYKMRDALTKSCSISAEFLLATALKDDMCRSQASSHVSIDQRLCSATNRTPMVRALLFVALHRLEGIHLHLAFYFHSYYRD